MGVWIGGKMVKKILVRDYRDILKAHKITAVKPGKRALKRKSTRSVRARCPKTGRFR